MSLRRATDELLQRTYGATTDELLQRTYGATTDDSFDIHFGQRSPDHEFSRTRDLDILGYRPRAPRIHCARCQPRPATATTRSTAAGAPAGCGPPCSARTTRSSRPPAS